MAFSRNEEILQAILNDEDISGLPVPQSREEALLLGILDKIRNGGGGSAKELIHICTTDEYNQITGVPTISSPDEGTLYLVPASSATTGNLFDEWAYANSAWERVGSVNVDAPVKDVQTNGVSVLGSQGIANIPFATSNRFGVVRLGNGVANSDGIISPYYARSASIKQGVINYDVIVPANQHESVFYGLAKVAGSDEKNSTLSLGQYTDAAKSAISQMLNGSVVVTGTTPTINALPGIRYVCGEVATIDITLPASGVVNVVFTSGSTPTVLAITPPTGQTVKWANGFDPTALEADTTYELSIADGSTGIATMYGPESAKRMQSDWNQTDSTAVDYIRNKPNVTTPHNFAYDGRDLSTIFADADALYNAYSVENYDNIHVGDYWPVTLNGTYRDYGQLSAPVGTTYYSDTELTTEAGVTDQIYTAEGVQNVNIPGCHEAYCSIKIDSTTYYVAWNDCLPYLERTLSNAIMKFEVAAINHYWRYGDTGSGNFQNGRPHLVMSARDGLPHTLKMRKLNEVWEDQHVDTFTGDGTTSEFTLSGTVGTIGYVFVAGTKKTYNTHYTYSNNKITFKAGQIPADGAEIKIEWCEGFTPWSGSALYRTVNDPDYGILKLIQQAGAKLYSHIYLGPNSKGMRYNGETRTKTNQQSGAWSDRGILFLPTEDEIWGRLLYGANSTHTVIQRQFALYNDGRRHISKGVGNAASRHHVWTSSSTGVTYFAAVSNHGTPTYANASYALAAAPCFLLT